MNRIIAGLIITLLPCAALAQKASTAADQVPIEEYVPKVIIEGKWGTGPGEFGIYDEPWNSTAFSPSSLAVDSKGSIYVLDHVNDRIQKFTSAGKFLKIIPVEGFSGNRRNEDVTFFVDRDNPDVNVSPDHPRKVKIKKKVEIIEPDFKTVGINIVIDSKDNLYYYLKRVKDGKETGEVWQFRNDKLVEKMKPGEENRLEESVSDFKQEKTASGVRVKFARNKRSQELAISKPINMATGEKFKVYAPMVRGGKTIIKTGISAGEYTRKPEGVYVMEERNAVNYVLSPDGKLITKISGNLPFDITAFDKELNGYALKPGSNALKVIKYKLTGVAK